MVMSFTKPIKQEKGGNLVICCCYWFIGLFLLWEHKVGQQRGKDELGLGYDIF